MEEEYRPIKGYEGKYEISNYGNVRVLKTKTGLPCCKVMKPSPVKDGYLMVDLCSGSGTRVDRKRKSRQVHRLVLEAFVGESKLECNHKDYDRKNNRLDNLEYVTRAENAARGKRCRATKLSEEDIPIIRGMAKRMTHEEIAKIYLVTREAITSIVNRKNWKHID